MVRLYKFVSFICWFVHAFSRHYTHTVTIVLIVYRFYWLFSEVLFSAMLSICVPVYSLYIYTFVNIFVTCHKEFFHKYCFWVHTIVNLFFFHNTIFFCFVCLQRVVLAGEQFFLILLFWLMLFICQCAFLSHNQCVIYLVFCVSSLSALLEFSFTIFFFYYYLVQILSYFYSLSIPFL